MSLLLIVTGKGGSSGMFWRGQLTFGEGQMVFWEGPNCPKKSILSMQRHRHNLKFLHRLEGSKSWFQSLWEGT